MKNFNEILKHPSTTLILGDTGEGKTVAMVSAMEWFKDKGCYVYLMDKPGIYPKWVHNLSSNNIDMKEPNSVLCIDDAHNFFYAGMEEDRDDLKALDLINRARRHGGKRSVVYNTQMSTVLSRKLIGMTTFLVFKRSSPVQIEFERPEFQKLFIEANEALKDQPINIGYVVSADYRGLIQIDMPKWFTEEISEAKEPNQRGTAKREGIFKSAIDSIKAIGRMS
jgi:hypothetical protein